MSPSVRLRACEDSRHSRPVPIAVVAMQGHGHQGVDTLVSRLPAIGKKFCAVLVS